MLILLRLFCIVILCCTRSAAYSIAKHPYIIAKIKCASMLDGLYFSRRTENDFIDDSFWFVDNISNGSFNSDTNFSSTNRVDNSESNSLFGNISQEYVSLAQRQFDLLVNTLDVSRCALGFRKENPETGALEFATVAVYPPKKRVWVVSEDGKSQKHDGLLELPGFIAATTLLPQYPFVSVSLDSDGMETSSAVENEDCGLSAPLVYGSLVIGMLTVWRDLPASQQSTATWSQSDKKLLENVASSLAVGAALDRRQQFAAAAQVKELRRILSETLHQAKNPLTALRTFGKLLLRRLPDDESLNRELVEDIILQSDRLVDLLLPVDDAVSALSAPKGSNFLPMGEYAIPPSQMQIENYGTVRDGWHMGGDDRGLLFVQDAVEPVIRTAEALALAQNVLLKCRVDDDLPGVFGNERALQEAVSNLIDNALKYVKMDNNMGMATRMQPIILLRVQLATDKDWGKGRGVVIRIYDNGPGIDPRELPRIFDRGYRGSHALKSGLPGTGLGLGIVRDVMRAMGGDVSVSNRLGHSWGTCASLFLHRYYP